jgi:hypothetical protein
LVPKRHFWQSISVKVCIESQIKLKHYETIFQGRSMHAVFMKKHVFVFS